MAKQPQPRKHHYLPQFYLRGFSVDGQSLYQVSRTTGKAVGVRIKDTAAIRDFHEIDAEDVDDPHILEKQLAQVEAELAPHLVEALGGRFQCDEPRQHVLQLLAMLRLRVPAVKEHIQRTKASVVHTCMRVMEKAGKLPPAPAGFENALHMDNLRIEITNWSCLETIFSTAADESMLRLLWSMCPTLIYSPFGARFVTCDQPVALFHPDAAPGIGVGPSIPGVQISLPLSSRALLVLETRSGLPTTRTGTTAEVDEFNRRTITMAQKYVFSGEAPARLKLEVEACRGETAGFKHDEVVTTDQYLQFQRFEAVAPA